ILFFHQYCCTLAHPSLAAAAAALPPSSADSISFRRGCAALETLTSPPLPIRESVREKMEVDGGNGIGIRVKATFRLGSETHSVAATKGEGAAISEELVAMKEESMRILKEFITKHNVPADVPDELVEDEDESSEEEAEDEVAEKSKKTKLT
ncbi:unnamed protein product, partial [Linum tenue]